MAHSQIRASGVGGVNAIMHSELFPHEEFTNSELVVGPMPPGTAAMLRLWTREQCEQFQMSHFGVTCATCERPDAECPWHREDDNEMTTAAQADKLITSNAA